MHRSDRGSHAQSRGRGRCNLCNVRPALESYLSISPLLRMRARRYLALSSEFFRYGDGDAAELVGSQTFASALPSKIYVGPNLNGPQNATAESPGNPAVMVMSTQETKFIRRVCPSVNETRCDYDSSYSEPVVTKAYVSEVAYNTNPRNTIDCSTRTLQCAQGQRLVSVRVDTQPSHAQALIGSPRPGASTAPSKAR
jgi:hypothetical protein